MNHRPFEDWLLDDQALTTQQQRELHAHLRTCTRCASIADANLALHSARLIGPPEGFTNRFENRLQDWRQRQRWRQTVGTLVLVLGGLGLLYWAVGSAIQEALDSPATWITAAATYVVFFLSSFRVLSEVAGLLLRDLPDFIPPIVWLILFLACGCLGATAILIFRRLSHVRQGAST